MVYNRAQGTRFPVVVRFDKDGSFDFNFNGGNILTSPTQGLYRKVVQYDDALYLTGIIRNNENSDYDLYLSKYNQKYQINSNFNIEILSIQTPLDLFSGNGHAGDTTALFMTNNRIPLAISHLHLDEDVTWDYVTGDSKPTDHKSFIAGLEKAPAVNNGYSLLIPFNANHNQIGVCPYADGLAKVSPKCENIYYISTEHKDVELIDIDSQSYYAVKGLYHTGIFFIYRLPQTGTPATFIIPLGLLLLKISAQVTNNINNKNLN